MPSIVIVTGGASGIGFEICRYFLQHNNAHVVLFDNNAQAGSRAVEKLSTEFPTASLSFVECNVASWKSQGSAFQQVYEQHGQIDVVFANAGIFEQEPIYGENIAELKEPNVAVVDVNINGVIYSINLAVHYMAKNAISNSQTNTLRGKIICTSSNAGIYPFPTLPLYTASKHAVVGLVRSLGKPLARPDLRIQINAFAPGPIKTNFSSNLEVYNNLFTTSFSTVIRTIDLFMKTSDLTGQVFEVHGEHSTLSPPPDYQHEETGKNIEYYWSLGHI